jgi:hypothetical protein
MFQMFFIIYSSSVTMKTQGEAMTIPKAITRLCFRKLVPIRVRSSCFAHCQHQHHNSSMIPSMLLSVTWNLESPLLGRLLVTVGRGRSQRSLTRLTGDMSGTTPRDVNLSPSALCIKGVSLRVRCSAVHLHTDAAKVRTSSSAHNTHSSFSMNLSSFIFIKIGSLNSACFKEVLHGKQCKCRNVNSGLPRVPIWIDQV